MRMSLKTQCKAFDIRFVDPIIVCVSSCPLRCPLNDFAVELPMKVLLSFEDR